MIEFTSKYRVAIPGRTKILTLLLALSALALVGCISISLDGDSSGEPDETQLNTFLVDDNPTIEISGFNGSIEVVTGNDGGVDVEAGLTRPDRISYSASASGNTVTITAEQTGSGVTVGRGSGVNIRVVAPRDSAISARTSNGAIKVEGNSRAEDIERLDHHSITDNTHRTPTR
ncbi:MAG: hypothetical protein QF357_10675 [Dehalococcoidia bacterium]|jgi:hypothetical protein|nr:hypothetical protein [Dehalococcoidia bacterium]